MAAAKTARSISGASSVATGAFLPGVADIRVSGFPRRTEPRVGASDAPDRAARRAHAADRVRAAEKTRGETICVNTFFDRNRGVQIRPRKLRVRARQSIGEIVLRC